jgi:hypothetical protein
MDSSFTIKPRDTISRVGVGRTPLVRTELAPSQSVSAATPVTDTHVPLTEGAGREPVINPQAQALLNREQEERSKRAKRAADEALLRQRAYSYGSPVQSATRDEDHDPKQDPHADIEV